MTPEFVVSLAKEGVILTLIVSAPMLLLGLVVGLAISIFQAVTSISEMTLTFIPKIIAVFMGMLFFAPWMIEKMTSYTIKLITSIPMFIK
ncbi:MAG: flagellar biosynthesis protein FliQ [Desulfobacteraceae bacterium]|jgi:flagellar biosynthetic protein FliQ